MRRGCRTGRLGREFLPQPALGDFTGCSKRGLAMGAVVFFDRLRITVVGLGQRIPGEMQIQVEV